MVHTGELTYFPDKELINAFKHLPDTVYYQQDKIWYNGSLKEKGLIFKLRIIDNGVFSTIRMICRINFKKVVNPNYNAKVEVLTENEVGAVEQKFNSLVQSLCPWLPKFQRWKVNRIDYCFNVLTPNVEDYLNLFKKGDRKYLRDWYDRNGNYTQKKGSLYLVSTAENKKNRTATVNFYNKLDQILTNAEVPDTDQDWFEFDTVTELAENVLRLEVQCHKAKTEYIKKKYGLPDKGVLNFLNLDIASDIITTYLDRIAGRADYHRKRVAFQLIDDNSSIHDSTKDKMKLIIEEVGKQHSAIYKIREKFAGDGTMSKKEFNRVVKKMYALNINPVTISDTKRLNRLHLNEGLPSVHHLLVQAIENKKQ